VHALESGSLLVVDDDRSLREAIVRALELEGYCVAAAENGAEALSYFEGQTRDVDAVVLDVLMPNLDGITTCRAIRARSRVPILMLTALQSVNQRVEGLDAGADDYLSKPFAVAELLARIRALLRRTAPAEGELRYADLVLDRGERRVTRGGELIDLTRIEFELLELFLSQPHKALARATIFKTVWGYDLDLASNSLEVYISGLRRKTEAAGGPRLIQTVRGFGYLLRAAE
jgi:two-component system response regulator MprA